MISEEFLAEFKQRTEAHWERYSLNRTLYGFQFQPGTRWNPGLSPAQISAYEGSLEVEFPEDFKRFLERLNGTDLPTLNVYGECGEPYRESVGVYSYPRDFERVKERIKQLECNWEPILQVLAEEGLKLPIDDVRFVPFYADRYVVCLPDRTRSEVVSVVDEDAIIYGWSLQDYLTREFLSKI